MKTYPPAWPLDRSIPTARDEDALKVKMDKLIVTHVRFFFVDEHGHRLINWEDVPDTARQVALLEAETGEVAPSHERIHVFVAQEVQIDREYMAAIIQMATQHLMEAHQPCES